MDYGKLISYFPTFKDIRNLSFMSNLRLMPQNNMPVFKDNIFLNQEKTGKLFLNRDSGQTTFSI